MSKMTDDEYIRTCIQKVEEAEKEGDIPHQPARVVAQLYTELKARTENLLETKMTWMEDIEKLGIQLGKRNQQSMIAQDKIRRLRVALHDAIDRAKGIVPDSADEFYRNGTGAASCDEEA